MDVASINDEVMVAARSATTIEAAAEALAPVMADWTASDIVAAHAVACGLHIAYFPMTDISEKYSRVVEVISTEIELRITQSPKEEDVNPETEQALDECDFDREVRQAQGEKP